MANNDTDKALHASGIPRGTFVIPECEVISEGESGNMESLYEGCVKNPGHKNFIPICEFKMEHLPDERQTQEMMDYIMAKSNLTVRVTVRYTSKQRPDSFADCEAPYPYSAFRGSRRKIRFGTGSIIYITPENEPVKGEPCPCHMCKTTDQPITEFWKVLVRTATHVIYDDSEVVHAIFDCFFDSDGREGVKHLYGCRVLTYTGKQAMDTYLSDLCHVQCFTHDRELVQKLEGSVNAIQDDFAIPGYEIPLGILISHPHGCSKKITLGNILHLTYPMHQNYPDNVEALKCRLPLFPWSKYDENFSSFFDISSPTNSSSSQGDDEQKLTKSDELKSDFCPYPGTEFSLPDDMVISFPDNPPFVLQYHYHQPDWFIFPPQTKFTLANGTDIFFPPEAEFFDNGSVSGCCFATYNTDSCPGSSGANVIHDLGRHQFRINFPHMGSVNATENRSGLHYYDLLKRL